MARLKSGNAALPCCAAKAWQSRLGVRRGQRPGMRLGRVERLKSGNAALACCAAKDRQCRWSCGAVKALAKPLGRVAAKPGLAEQW
ncbi:hypothetical protein [Paenibacillus sp. BR1-192]|uniref:hypothetical protein n=1 Tax=Paenibacillus sp. BR1-192 TaxID=3032287 RepID=UPI00240E5DB9|nr:hypothetical protein [Paenibacillus sp. BR1-192]WFB56996.1 hypothetical protein P0X86_23885 [Paenibacillus sp. BR1-192]